MCPLLQGLGNPPCMADLLERVTNLTIKKPFWFFSVKKPVVKIFPSLITPWTKCRFLFRVSRVLTASTPETSSLHPLSKPLRSWCKGGLQKSNTCSDFGPFFLTSARVEISHVAMSVWISKIGETRWKMVGHPGSWLFHHKRHQAVMVLEVLAGLTSVCLLVQMCVNLCHQTGFYFRKRQHFFGWAFHEETMLWSKIKNPSSTNRLSRHVSYLTRFER